MVDTRRRIVNGRRPLRSPSSPAGPTVWGYSRGRWSKVPDPTWTADGPTCQSDDDIEEERRAAGFSLIRHFGSECSSVRLSVYEDWRRDVFLFSLWLGHNDSREILAADLPSAIDLLAKLSPLLHVAAFEKES